MRMAGLLNPLLYSLAARSEGGMRDVTIGTIDLYGVGCCTAGPGYDMATGWGSFALTPLAAALRSPSVTLAAPASPPPGQPVTLTATATTPAGTIVRYDWDLDGNDTVDESTTDPSLVWTPTAAQTTVIVTARSDLGRSGSASVNATLVATPVAAAVVVAPRFSG